MQLVAISPKAPRFLRLETRTCVLLVWGTCTRVRTRESILPFNRVSRYFVNHRERISRAVNPIDFEENPGNV